MGDLESKSEVTDEETGRRNLLGPIQNAGIASHPSGKVVADPKSSTSNPMVRGLQRHNPWLVGFQRILCPS